MSIRNLPKWGWKFNIGKPCNQHGGGISHWCDGPSGKIYQSSFIACMIKHFQQLWTSEQQASYNYNRPFKFSCCLKLSATNLARRPKHYKLSSQCCEYRLPYDTVTNWYAITCWSSTVGFRISVSSTNVPEIWCKIVWLLQIIFEHFVRWSLRSLNFSPLKPKLFSNSPKWSIVFTLEWLATWAESFISISSPSLFFGLNPPARQKRQLLCWGTCCE